MSSDTIRIEHTPLKLYKRKLKLLYNFEIFVLVQLVFKKFHINGEKIALK